MARMMLLIPLLFGVGCPAPIAEDTDTGGAETGSGDTAADTDTGGDTDTGSDTADSGTDTGTDTGADTGGDTGGDTGTDTGADTGTDTGGDTAETGDTADTGDTGSSTSCTDADLVLTAEVRDSAGVSGTSFGVRDSLSMVAVLSNPCTSDVSVKTASDCLFTGWSVEDSRGSGSGVAVACRPVVTTWTVPAGGSLEESQSWGTLRADSYVLTVTADVPAGSAAVKFSVI